MKLAFQALLNLLIVLAKILIVLGIVGGVVIAVVHAMANGRGEWVIGAIVLCMFLMFWRNEYLRLKDNVWLNKYNGDELVKEDDEKEECGCCGCDCDHT